MKVFFEILYGFYGNLNGFEIHKNQKGFVLHLSNFQCNKINLLNLKQSLYRLVIFVKMFLKLSNLHMLIKQKNPLFHRSLALRNFRELL